MTSADQLIEIFNEAKALPTGAERERFLADACANDPQLKEQVISLLQSHEGAGDFLEHTQFFPFTPSLTEKPGDRIGRYKLLEQIGEGGCGVVYMAEQLEPVRRRVALKVIKLGMDTKSVIARFEAERQALALMDHPNIAKVLDGGATDTGRPYFVMELVRGIKITDYCDQNSLSTTDRLELFIQVCQAIQHAHQKGIIHRDIKPSNILVTQHDDVAVPKVIDFGIAKATTGQLTDKTVFTAFAQFIGTPAYMSPEQAQMSGLDIDTRADIYSLGVLLYELLTGNPPFDGTKLIAAGLDEMRRKIREDEPPRPSTCLSTMTAIDLTTVAKHRHEEPPKLIHLIRGDLDWLVMKCLEKDRTRRYETASALATDLQRHLDDEPVVARPPSNLYRFQKLVRRNKLAFAATSAVMAALVLGVFVSSWQALRATRAEREQNHLRQQAQAEAARNRQAAIFLGNLAETLRQDRNLTNSESAYRESLAMWRKLHGNDHPSTDFSLSGLSYVLEDQGKLAEAETLTREALDNARKSSTNDPTRLEFLVAALANVLRFQSNYAGAELLNREALAIARLFATNDLSRLELRIADVADILRRQEKYAEAEPFFREALTRARQFTTNDPSRLRGRINDLADVLKRQGKFTEAQEVLSEKLAPEASPASANK
ncbi:MAG: serine/threonine-protein kinase [Verrucomicrobiota bacterium]